MDIKYTFFDPQKYIDQVVELEKDMWKNTPKSILKNILLWKYPKTQLKNAFIALDGNKVVAFRGFFINNYYIYGNTYPVAVLGDAITDSAYQRKGIFSGLTQYALNYYNNSNLYSILSLSSNELSSKGNIKMGWKPILIKKMGIRVSFSKIFFSDRLLKRYLLYNLRKNEIELIYLDKINNKIAEDLGKYFNSIYNPEEIELKKDQEFWNHRYLTQECNFNFFLLRKENKIIGYVCYTIEYNNTLKCNMSKVVDISALTKKGFSLLVKAVSIYSKNKITIINTTSPRKRESKWVNQLFPIQRKSSKKKCSSYILNKKVSSLNLSDICEDGKWVFNYIDLDCLK